MGHVMDWIEVWPQRGYKKITEENKEIGLNGLLFLRGSEIRHPAVGQRDGQVGVHGHVDERAPAGRPEAVRRARLRRCSRSTTASSTASWYSTT